MKTFPCTVVHKSHPRPDCTSVGFAPPADVEFNAYPGQHVVVRFPVQGTVLARCYSLHDGPFSGHPWTFTARRIEGGKMSTALYELLQPGMTLECTAPSGRFHITPDPGNYHHHYFYAAGTGITPILAMVQAVLRYEPRSFATLLYGNRRAATSLFRARLHTLASQYADRFAVQEVFSEDRGSWRGRINAGSVEMLLAEHQPRAQQVRHFICGPTGMDDTVRSALLDLGAVPGSIHSERFGSTAQASSTTQPATVAPAALTVKRSNDTLRLPVQPGQTLLAGMKQHGLDPPHSCESGVCGACTARLTRGRVQMRGTMALTEDELRDGMVLPCQALAVTPEVELSY